MTMKENYVDVVEFVTSVHHFNVLEVDNKLIFDGTIFREKLFITIHRVTSLGNLGNLFCASTFICLCFCLTIRVLNVVFHFKTNLCAYLCVAQQLQIKPYQCFRMLAKKNSQYSIYIYIRNEIVVFLSRIGSGCKKSILLGFRN